ncbi:MAG: hypothetical protein AAGA48_27755 [Myxococcota bacterium]
MSNEDLDVRIPFRTLRWFLLLSVVGSVTVATCNTLVVAHGDIQNWPMWSMNLAYWAGSMTLAFSSVGIVLVTFVGLRPAGLAWALPPALLFGYFLALGSAGHGSFFPLYETHQVMLAAPEGSEARTVVEGLRGQMRLNMFVLFFTPVTLLAIGSIWYSLVVFFRSTLFPRWMGLVNLFAIALATFTLGEQTFIPEPFKTLFQGFGFHGGLLTYYALAYTFLARRDRESGETAYGAT